MTEEAPRSRYLDCSACGTPEAVCTDEAYSSGMACCPKCAYTFTHESR